MNDLKFKLTTKAANKMKERSRKLADNLVYIQEVCPSYIKLLIKAYFDVRKRDTLNINARYLILMEASLFKCRETIEILEKVNACDKNCDLRLIWEQLTYLQSALPLNVSLGLFCCQP